ncbi:hypothetical protein ABIF38_008780 [Bradyrhizobium japonicum]|uniref:DUF4007 family protein n=1 Tax=Bradyrhizobium elkanii TaxID=29448 RepID=UPI00035ED8EE|nr:DUF4007 family protein [Bradyrhizobium elkanii]MCP1728904.1 hypothetical protein [Bradyrhizobium elkanii]MCS3573029.1 hypothetical protein [Bradyrhizobium elkanii]MCS3594278.1 hypothetical protein [Bradyrhizobium elkanii]MCS3623721.1 hypothetical protein [Bradyrhizobium elkanii]UQD79914.1 DUF4007 family protein [Bradyrhizobium elkanii USDA 76]
MRSTKASALQRFEFGRHETFAIRHGWLSKGLVRVRDSAGGFQADIETADELGLGSKMVKSLSYWLEASGVASVAPHTRPRQLSISRVGGVIAERDPFFEFPVSWWFVHLALANRDNSIFGWFFNDYPQRTFDRLDCVDAYQRYLRERATKPPSVEMVQRDVSCLLASYADEPGKLQDPEDGTICPLTDLGLLAYHSDTRRFERIAPHDGVSPEILLACASKLGLASGLEAVSISELATWRHGPGRIFQMASELIDEAAAEAARAYARSGVTFDRLGGERRLRAAHKPPEFWLAHHYDRIGASA